MTTHGPLRVLGIADVDYIHTHKWAQYLAHQGHRLHLISLSPPASRDSLSHLGPMVTVDAWTIPPLHLKRCWISLRAILRLRTIARSFRPNLVHAHFLGHGAWYAALARLQPLVISVMGGGDIQGEKWQPTSHRERLLTPFALRRSRRVLCWSRHLAEIVAPFLPARTQLEVLVGGIDLARFKRTTNLAELRQRLQTNEGDFVILSPRLYWPRSNIEIIIRAMALVLRALPRARLVLVKHRAHSYPEHEQAMERLIDELGVRYAVRSLPSLPYDEMPRYYSLADCTVSVPSTDGTPMTVLESAACGTPTVILDLPDYDPDIFLHRSSVLRAARPTPSAVAREILAVAQDERLRETLQTHGRKAAEGHADYWVEMTRLTRIYCTLVGKEP